MQIDVDQLWLNGDTLNYKRADKIYIKQNFLQKEYGLNSTLLIHALIRWKSKKANRYFTSPLLYQPVELVQKKRESISYSISYEEESSLLINPILRKLFEEEFSLNLPEEIDLIGTLFNLLKKEFSSLVRTPNFNEENSWQFIELEAVGIFNYRKALLYKDYEIILSSPGNSVQNVLGEKMDVVRKKATPIFVPTIDLSQQHAIQNALMENTLIQGPPGTGKSETLVTLIEYLLTQNKKVLFVSEKKSALEVVYDRLKKDKMDWAVARFEGSENEKTYFYNYLKKTYTKLSDRTSIMANSFPSKIAFPATLEFYPLKMLRLDELSNVNLQQLYDRLIVSGYSLGELSTKNSIPAYRKWNEVYEFLRNFDEAITPEFGVTTFSKATFFNLNSALFGESEITTKLASRIDQIEKSLNQISVTAEKYSLTKNLNKFIRIAIAGSILSMVNKQQLDLLQPDQKKHKQFNTLAKKYQQVKIKLNQIELVNLRWKKKPTIAEITELTDLLKQNKKPKSILGILKRNAVKSPTWFSEFSPSLSVMAKLQMLEEIRTEWHLRGELELLKIKLRHELHILDPDTEIDHILQVRNKLNTVSENEYVEILSRQNSEQIIAELSQLHPSINRAVNLINYLFNSELREDLDSLTNCINRIREELPLIEKYEHELAALFRTDISILDFIRNSNGTLEQLDATVTLVEIHKRTRFDIQSKNLTGEILLSEFKTYKNNILKYKIEQTKAMFYVYAEQLHELEKLATIPSTRLKSEKQKLKQKFKDTKRILVHEFNKIRQHLAIKELMRNHSEMILSLQPVWMMNPLSAGKLLPCVPDLFDYVIFDEASQIPLEDAIPSIYRAANLIVVGDSKQMPPSDFFKSSADSTTLLDQSTFHLKNVFLQNHYRSEHPALIQFSNAHFYDFELAVLPPVNYENPIEHIFVNGIFEEQKNLEEAKAVANYYKRLQMSGVNDVAIIAFSKEQQRAVEQELQKLNTPENSSLIIRNLENVQGIEKKIVLISIGYAKNKAGVFRKNFGPVNSRNGANRLNVLFTRAIQKMIVFASVHSSEFGYTENTGATLLAAFLRYVENGFGTVENVIAETSPLHQKIHLLLKEKKCTFQFYSPKNGCGISCFVNHQTSAILIADPCTGVDESRDLSAMLNGILERFKKCKIILSSEYLQNAERVSEDIVKFMR